MQEIIIGAMSGTNPVSPISVAPVWYDVPMAPLRMTTSVSSTFSRVSRQSFVTCHRFSSILCSVSVKEFAGISKKISHVWRVRPLLIGEEGIFLPVHDVSGVSIRGMVIVFGALGASHELGAKVQ